MNLERLGYSDFFESFRCENQIDLSSIGRITAEHKERYTVSDGEKEFEAEITGNIRFTAREPSDFPAVGDWVVLQHYDENQVIIHQLFPRKTMIERMAVGRKGEKQLMAANVDYSLILQGLNNDYNVNRLERYLAISLAGGITPVILLSKTDLIPSDLLKERTSEVNRRHPEIRLIPFSNISSKGIEEITQILQAGKSYCCLGSSGAGKSTLINQLFGKELMKTGSMSQSTGKGRHTTSHRELFLLDNGSIIIDTPGMREIGIVDHVDDVFSNLHQLTHECRFNDCSHLQEEGCALLTALEGGMIEREAYENYLKMLKEAEWSTATIAEKRKKDKAFGKMIKQVMKSKGNENP